MTGICKLDHLGPWYTSVPPAYDREGLDIRPVRRRLTPDSKDRRLDQSRDQLGEGQTRGTSLSGHGGQVGAAVGLVSKPVSMKEHQTQLRPRPPRQTRWT